MFDSSRTQKYRIFSVNAYVGLLIWGGLYLRDDRLRELIPLRG